MIDLKFFDVLMSGLFFDFDGVFTDNSVYISDNNIEMVRCSKLDSMGIKLLNEKGVKIFVVSTERSLVVKNRCDKLQIPCFFGVEQKDLVLRDIAKNAGIDLSRSIFVGNDVNDLNAFQTVGCTIAPSDAHPKIKSYVDYVLHASGGNGAIRELVDLLLGELEN